MRDLYMKTGQGFLLVFSITSASSLSELTGLRDEIIRIKDDENIPIVIVGNKLDLEEQRSVPRSRAFALSQLWGVPYYEASARTRSMLLAFPRISAVFDLVIWSGSLTRMCSQCGRGVCRCGPTNAPKGRRRGISRGRQCRQGQQPEPSL